MFEKRWAAVSPQSFTTNGTSNGVLTVIDSSLFKVKQQVNITANTLPNLNLEIKSIPDDVTIIVGPIGATIFTYSNISMYTTALSSAISANEQKRSSVPVEEINRAVYEEEPVVAIRNILVDQHGQKYTQSNPFPVDATISGDSPTVILQVLNVPLILANTDYTISLPAGIYQFQTQIRDGKGPLRLYESSSANFYSIARGAYYKSEIIRNSSLSLTVQSSQSACVLEILCWVRI